MPLASDAKAPTRTQEVRCQRPGRRQPTPVTHIGGARMPMRFATARRFLDRALRGVALCCALVATTRCSDVPESQPRPRPFHLSLRYVQSSEVLLELSGDGHVLLEENRGPGHPSFLYGRVVDRRPSAEGGGWLLRMLQSSHLVDAEREGVVDLPLGDGSEEVESLDYSEFAEPQPAVLDLVLTVRPDGTVQLAPHGPAPEEYPFALLLEPTRWHLLYAHRAPRPRHGDRFFHSLYHDLPFGGR